MARNVLIVGAGPGLSLATARRFGANGYTVHLVARTQSRLSELKAMLKADGISAETYVQDITQHADLTRLVRRIDDATAIDVCIFQPGGRSEDLVDVLDATVANARINLELITLGSLSVGQALVPAMLGRGAGSLVFVGGGSARQPLRMFGNLGMAMAGLRHYALTLNTALATSGVHAAFYTVAGLIATGPAGPGELDPLDLAERMWTLATKRDAREVIMTANGEVVPKGAR
jgi:short-subunit dehydrogenase